MNRRSMLYTALAALASTIAAGCASQSRISPGAVGNEHCCCCCCDPNCKPGCCEECPPDCKPQCPPGCCDDCYGPSQCKK